MIQLPEPFRPSHKGGMCSFPTHNRYEMEELKRLSPYTQFWNESILNRTKYLITRLRKLPPLAAYGNNFYNEKALGWWDAHRRMTMLEPLAADIITSNISGDFVEAGVFRGGISLFMATMLKMSKQFQTRKMWMADLFGKGMPNQDYTHAWMKYHNVDVNSLETQGKNWTGMFKMNDLSEMHIKKTLLLYLGAEYSSKIGTISGLFERSLPGPIRNISLLRIDVDEYSATYDALTYLYPLISKGGYVVFDDWKIWQAQQAILQYRKEQHISSLLYRTRRDWPLPHQSIDCMVYWKKE